MSLLFELVPPSLLWIPFFGLASFVLFMCPNFLPDGDPLGWYFRYIMLTVLVAMYDTINKAYTKEYNAYHKRKFELAKLAARGQQARP